MSAYTFFTAGVNALSTIIEHNKVKTLIILKNLRLQFHKVLSFQKKTIICNIIALAAMQQSR